MPGRPYRVKHLAPFIEQLERKQSRYSSADKLLPAYEFVRSPKQRRLFRRAVQDGLVSRLARNHRADMEVALEAAARASILFPDIFRSEGAKKACEFVATQVATWTERDLAGAEKPNPMTLLVMSGRILHELPRERHKRFKYLCQEGLEPDEAGVYAGEKDAVVTEKLLSNRIGMSQSAVHKLLWKAARKAKTSLLGSS